MNLYALFALSFLPVIFLFMVFAVLVPGFRIVPGVVACVLGVAAVFPASLCQFLLLKISALGRPSFVAAFVSALVVNGLVEEFWKALALCALPRRRLAFPVFFCCCVLLGLALGSFETVIYVTRRLGASLPGLVASVGTGAVLKLILARLFSAQAVHAFCAALVGVSVWAFFGRRAGRVMPFMYAVVSHGIFNFFIAFSSAYRFLSVVAILFAAVECRIWYVSARGGADSPGAADSAGSAENRLTKSE